MLSILNNKMNCHCGEKAFTFTQISSRNGKKITCLVGRCNRSLEETNKKKNKCDFRCEKVLEIKDLPHDEVKSHPILVTRKPVETKKDYIKELVTAINTIKVCQDTGYPFDKYTHRILYLSKKLNIPPYIQEKYTIEEYYNITDYFLKNPIPIKKQVPIEKYSIINDFLEYIKSGAHTENLHGMNDYEHFKNLLTIERTIVKVKPSSRVIPKVLSTITTGKFKTGAIDDEDLIQEDELDIEEFYSEEEDYPCDDDYRSD